MGVKRIELEVEAFGSRAVLNPTLVWDEESAVLIDAGMPGTFGQICAAMAEAGVPFEKLNAVILTHQDLDHIGAMPELLQAGEGRITVYAHELDKPYIEGTLPLIKNDPAKMAKVLESLPEAVREQALAALANPPKAPVDRLLADGDELPFGGGIRVLFTPGHTPGHISLYLKQSKTLVAGDALVSANGTLHGPVPQTTLDMATALQSLRQFADLDAEAVICYHGGLTTVDVREQLQRLASQV